MSIGFAYVWFYKGWHKPVEIYEEKSEAQNMCKVEWFSLV